MRSAATISGLLIALGVGYFLYTKSLTTAGGTQRPPQEQIDVVAIRTNLLNMGQAERAYLAAHGTYGTLEQLQSEGPPAISTEDRDKAGWATLMIDNTRP